MSYDYLLVRAPAGTPDPEDPEAAILAFVEAIQGGSIGTVDGVKAAVSKLFPSLKWERSQRPPGVSLPLVDVDWDWRAANDAGQLEISLGADEAADVRLISMSRCDRSEAEQVAKELGLLVLDEQSMEMFGG
jgi:hypothetical protein